MTKDKKHIIKTRVSSEFGHLTKSFLAYKDNGSQKEFTNFFNGTKNYLYQTLKTKGYYNSDSSILYNEFDDMYHDCVMKVLDDIDAFDPIRGSIVTYMYNIFKNKLIDRYRHEQVVLRITNMIKERAEEVCQEEEIGSFTEDL